MIVRIVKMTFLPEKLPDFIALFEERKEKIRQFPGCTYLELLQGIDGSETVFMTYSNWNAEEDLNNYRHSAYFGETWKLTKAMFAAKPEAISTIKLHSLL